MQLSRLAPAATSVPPGQIQPYACFGSTYTYINCKVRSNLKAMKSPQMEYKPTKKSHDRQDFLQFTYDAVVYQNGSKMKQLGILFSLNCLLTFSRYSCLLYFAKIFDIIRILSCLAKLQ
jgi:hypothetical protein